MKKFSDPFTQGGQTKLHDLHMMRQVISSTLKISMMVSLLAFALLLCQKRSWQDYYLLAAFYKAQARVYLDFLPRGFLDTTWLVADNVWLQSYDYYIVANPTYLKFLQHMQAHILKIFKLCALIFIASFAIISGFWVYRGKKRQQTTILKGYILSTPKALKKQIAKCGASTIQLADIPLPKNAECEHMMLCGTTGSGKTNAINLSSTNLSRL